MASKKSRQGSHGDASRVQVVSEEFRGKRLVQRHQLVYRLLDEELKGSVHALSIDAKCPEEL